jgi:ferredoxin-NADP reductase
MPEAGTLPRVPAGRRRALALLRSFTSPLCPDDYLELINPLWSTRELRGRIERIERETSEAVTVLIRPGWEWPGHRAGQFLRLGVDVDGVHHWRAYSLTSHPRRPDGCIAITPKLVPQGKVSPYLCTRARPGTIVRLGGVEGSFVLPSPAPERLLFVSAGSGITPIMSMLRALARAGALRDVVHVHCERSAAGVIFGGELRELAARHPGYRLRERHTGREGRLEAQELHALCADWSEREAFVCGTSGLIAALRERFKRDGDATRLHTEHFQPDAGLADVAHGGGGAIRFCTSGAEADSDGSQAILGAGESAGLRLAHGCRMGICHSCIGRLRSGTVRDLRTGRVHGQPGEMVRICVSAPEGPVELDL